MSKKLIKKYKTPSGPIEFVGMPQEEWDWMTYMFMADPDNPKYRWFKRYAIDKYGRQGDTQLPEVIVEAKRPEKTVKENAKDNLQEVKEVFKNLPTETKVDFALTGASFVPGLDIVADAIDFGRSIKNGDYSNAAWALAGFTSPISGQVLKNGMRHLKSLPVALKMRTMKLKPLKNIHVYHGTTNMFDDFNMSSWHDAGVHAGTRKQADDIIKQRLKEQTGTPQNAHIKEGIITVIDEPVEVPDLGMFVPDNYVRSQIVGESISPRKVLTENGADIPTLDRLGKISSYIFDERLKFLDSKQYPQLYKDFLASLNKKTQESLNQSGLNVLKYRNSVESDGWSYVINNPNNVVWSKHAPMPEFKHQKVTTCPWVNE